MKTFLVSLLTLVIAAFSLATRLTDVVTDLKMTTTDIHDQVFYQLTTEYPHSNLSGKARQIGKQLSGSARTSAVQAMGAVVRTYVQSADFKNRYDQWLRSKYRVSDGQTDEARRAETASMSEVHSAANQQMAQINTAFTQMPAATLAMMLQQQIMQANENMTDADAPTKASITRDLAVLRQLQSLANTKPTEFKTQYIAFMNRYLARQMTDGLDGREEKLAEEKAKAVEYRTRLAEYKANTDPNIAVKKKLRDFVALAESVDFDAKVEQQGYKQEFVRADYRNRSGEWKLLYRIGREPVLAARDMARAWLNDLK